ncbi:hypothetical protein [Ralstonia holmesii]|uniref:hypothetical protein n=1 Tax=Ralstonia holmesii TaxID=3058602 RepID=UPI002931D31C|nr:hypothetical protein [Ralstonia sp. LMG 32967]
MSRSDEKVIQLLREAQNTADVVASEVAHLRALVNAIEALGADPAHQRTVAGLASLGAMVAENIDGNLSYFSSRAAQIAVGQTSAG